MYVYMPACAHLLVCAHVFVPVRAHICMHACVKNMPVYVRVLVSVYVQGDNNDGGGDHDDGDHDDGGDNEHDGDDDLNGDDNDGGEDEADDDDDDVGDDDEGGDDGPNNTSGLAGIGLREVSEFFNDVPYRVPRYLTPYLLQCRGPVRVVDHTVKAARVPW